MRGKTQTSRKINAEHNLREVKRRSIVIQISWVAKKELLSNACLETKLAF